MKTLLMIVLANIIFTAPSYAAVGDYKCGNIILHHMEDQISPSYDPNQKYYHTQEETDYVVAKTCATVTSEVGETITLDLDENVSAIVANGLIFGTRLRETSRICKALGYKSNIILGAKIHRKSYRGIIVAGVMRGNIQESTFRIGTFSQVTCSE